MRTDSVLRAMTLRVALLCACGLAPAVSAAEPTRKPNVVVILADDLGYGDLGFTGCKDIPTPHLDALAKDGVRCTQGYVSAPQCSPTRAGLMTGRYQQRFGHEYNSAIAGSALSLKETTLAERLKAAGYATGLVGKWHLGDDEKHHPLGRGFQEFFGFLGGANPYLPDVKFGHVPRILRGKEPANEKGFLTEALGREAAAFIDRHQKEPFFLYLAFNAPHGPLQAQEKYLKRFEAIKDEKRRIYAAMLSALDDAVGVVLAKLRATGLEEQTLTFFFSDNGGPTHVNASSNRPFRGQKGDALEGGIRVPFVVRWKGTLPAGKVYDQPVIQLDIHPTALVAAGVEVKPEWKLDGVNLLPHLTGKDTARPHEVLFWRFLFPPKNPARHKWAVRQGDWKLVVDVERTADGTFKGDGALRLYNLATDPSEATDLREKEPERAKALEALWRKWNAQMAPPGEPLKAPTP